ncbi:hypothetical protein [Aliivibrio finisterrensis]|nr:hypothetical protein [Aliivibrio finisterrensis]
MSQRIKFYLLFFLLNGLAYLHIYLVEYPNPFIVLGVIMPIPLLSAWISWKVSRFSRAHTPCQSGDRELKFELCPHNIDFNKPLIYMWQIYDLNGEVVGRYIGKAKNGAKRPLKHYKRNVERLLSGKPYRKSKPEGFRRVHIALANAVESGHNIQLSFLVNIGDGQDINEVESSLIKANDCKGNLDWQLNG